MAVKPSDLQPTEAHPPTEADVMVGGPGQEPVADQAPANPYRELTINGRKFQVDPDLAETIAQREKDFDRKLQENSGELGRLRKFYSETQPKAPTVERKGYDTLLFEDPNGAMERAISEAVARVEAKAQAKENINRLFDRFYAQNKHLNRHGTDRFVVNGVINENMAELSAINNETELIGRVTELVSRELISREQPEETDEPISRTVVARPTTPTTPRAPVNPEDSLPSTLTEAIKRRQQQRRAGRAA